MEDYTDKCWMCEKEVPVVAIKCAIAFLNCAVEDNPDCENCYLTAWSCPLVENNGADESLRRTRDTLIDFIGKHGYSYPGELD